MWKHFYLVILFLSDSILSKSEHDFLIDTLFEALQRNLDYISRHHDKINVDCLFGVVLGGAILHDSLAQPGPYRDKILELNSKIRNIYTESIPVVNKQPGWDLFTKYIVVPELWPKPMRYKLAQFRTAYPMESMVENLFSKKYYLNFTNEAVSDSCLTSVVNSTKDLKHQTGCRLSPICEDYLEKLDTGVGYILTHKLLLLQVARARKCKMHPRVLNAAIKKVCHVIYSEAISVDNYLGIGETFDLVLEQILLCGFEGFADFLKREWLNSILSAQYEAGCFPVNDNHYQERRKREINIWPDGCADHTTGLGTGVLSLYLNYLLKNAETISLIPGWD